jgi:hypothetical protein
MAATAVALTEVQREMAEALKQEWIDHDEPDHWWLTPGDEETKSRIVTFEHPLDDDGAAAVAEAFLRTENAPQS